MSRQQGAELHARKGMSRGSKVTPSSQTGHFATSHPSAPSTPRTFSCSPLQEKLPDYVHLLQRQSPAKPPASNLALTSNSESGNFKHKNKQVCPRPQVEPFPRRPGGEKATAGNSGPPPLPWLHWGCKLWGLTTKWQMGASNPNQDKTDQAPALLMAESTRASTAEGAGDPARRALMTC